MSSNTRFAIALATLLATPVAFAQNSMSYGGGMQSNSMQNQQQMQQMMQNKQQNPSSQSSMPSSDMSQQDDAASRMVNAMDTDHDGYISASEHAAYFAALFKQADTNGDGKLSKDEVRAAMEKMHHDDGAQH